MIDTPPVLPAPARPSRLIPFRQNRAGFFRSPTRQGWPPHRDVPAQDGRCRSRRPPPAPVWPFSRSEAKWNTGGRFRQGAESYHKKSQVAVNQLNLSDFLPRKTLFFLRWKPSQTDNCQNRTVECLLCGRSGRSHSRIISARYFFFAISSNAETILICGVLFAPRPCISLTSIVNSASYFPPAKSS